MRYAPIKDTLQLSPTGSLSLTAAQTVTGRIRQQPFRLEGIMLILTAATVAGAVTNTAADMIAGLVKAIRLSINDAGGKRNIVQVSGPALLSYVRNCLGLLDRYTNASYFQYAAAADLVASTTYKVCFYVPLRHLLVAEPFGNFTSLPLGSRWLKEDPILEVDLRANTEVFNDACQPTACTLEAFLHMRDVPDSAPYIPSELLTTQILFNATGKQSYEISSSGYLTQMLLQGYSKAAYAADITRQSILSAGGQLLVEYGRDIRVRTTETALQAINDLTQVQLQGSDTTDKKLSQRCFTGEMFVDFMTDLPGTDAFSINSALNLNALGSGERCKLTFNDWVNATYALNLTHHKFLPRADADLLNLSVAI